MTSYIQDGSVGVKVNDDNGHYFQTYKGMRRGDPKSRILFNILTDLLAILVDGGVSILQYADDTVIFMEHDLRKVVS